MGQRFKGRLYPGLVFKKAECLINRHGKDLMYIPPIIGDFQNVLLKAFPSAVGAGDEDIREELHLYLLKTFSPACFAPARWRIKRKMGGAKSFCPGPGSLGQKIPNRVHGLGVCQGVGPWGASDGSLVHQDHIM